MFVSKMWKKKCESVEAELAIAIEANGRLSLEVLNMEKQLQKKETEIFRLNERIRNLQKKTV